MNERQKAISACIDDLLFTFGKKPQKIDKQTIVRFAQKYDLYFKDITVVENVLGKYNIEIWEGKKKSSIDIIMEKYN